MCVLFQRLSGGEAQNLNEELPEALQSMLRPCAIHPEQPDIFDRHEFLQRVGEHLNITPDKAKIVAQGVFAAIRTQITPKESKSVDNQLPVDLFAIWSAPPVGHQKRLDIRLGFQQIIFKDILADVADQGVLPEQVKPKDAVAAVMCVLSRRVCGEEARKLLKDLPRFLQEMVRPCASHPESPEVLERGVFIRRVADHLGIDEETAERITNGVG